MRGLVFENHQIILQEDLEIPMPRKNEVLVRVHCSSVTPFDLAMQEGKYDLFYKLYGFRGPVKSGLEFSGVVEQTGTHFKEGEKVFGYVDLMRGCKTHAEYIAISEDYMAKVPNGLPFEESAALPLGALTSYIALKELGEIDPGGRLLILGASGGLGVYAVQLGKLFGAHITAVAGPGQKAFLSRMGAHEVIDYENQDILQAGETFDVVLDLTTQYRFSTIKPILGSKGRFIPADPMKSSMDFALSLFSAKKAIYMMIDKGDREKLSHIGGWVKAGKLQSVVDSIYDITDFQQAFDRVKGKGRKGRVVLRLGD